MIRKNVFTLVFIVMVWGMMGIISPISATSTEEEIFPVFEGYTDNRIGKIVINPAQAHFTLQVNIHEQNEKSYYEIMAYHPSGIPPTITWGMIKANSDGSLRCNGNLDSITLAWIKNYGLSGAIYSVRLL